MTAQVAPNAQAAGTATGTPVVLFLPAIEKSPSNTAQRVAELIAIELTRGPGTYTVEHGPTVKNGTTHVADHWRIVDEEARPVLDLHAVDYQSCWTKGSVSGDGIKASIRQVFTALRCFWMAVRLVLAARRHAKTLMARAQLWVGLGAAVALLFLLGLTVWSAGAALAFWNIPKLPDTYEDVAGMGTVALFTWALLKSRPHLERATDIIRQFLDYTHDIRIVQGTTNAVRDALDPLVHEEGPKNVHLLGYSFGSLVALDLLFPKTSSRPKVDTRYAPSIASLITIGCPFDFMRLYFPDYPDGRTARIENLAWTNIFNAADVFGSNFRKGNDFSASSDPGKSETPFPPSTCVPTSIRFTDEQLSLGSIFASAGFVAHGKYWRDLATGNCMSDVIDVVLPAPQVPAPRRPV